MRGRRVCGCVCGAGVVFDRCEGRRWGIDCCGPRGVGGVDGTPDVVPVGFRWYIVNVKKAFAGAVGTREKVVPFWVVKKGGVGCVG